MKRVMTPLILIVLPLHTFFLFSGMTSTPINTVYCASQIILALGPTHFLGCGLLGMKMSTTLDRSILLYALGMILGDAYSLARMEPRSWVMVVLLLDCAVFFDRARIIPIVVTMILLWLFVAATESFLRFGLLDEVSSSFPEPCDCHNPPCRSHVSSSFGNWAIIAFVVLMDLYLTRSFATNLQIQLRKVKSSVDLATKVAAALARYDVDGAEEAITEGADLPEELVHSYYRLLHNLRSYRSYLPESLLYDDGGEDSPRTVANVPPPVGDGEQQVEVGMVFTDIQSSTELWEVCPEGMHVALQAHNTTLRQVAREHQGYEVKIIGDALMLAFAEAADAVAFGVEAQARMVQSECPLSLSKHSLCRRIMGPDGVPLWHGLRVRIGVNWGPARAERNPVTGRYDFFGGTVNTAARVEAAVKHGGLTGLTQAVVDKVGVDTLRNDVFIVAMGDVEMKGLAQPVAIHVVLPRALERRWRELHEGLIQAVNPVVDGLTLSISTRTSSSGRSSLSRLSAGSRHASVINQQIMPRCLDVGLRTSAATCATVRGSSNVNVEDGIVEILEEEVTAMLTRLLVTVETSALRTQGQVVCAVSVMCIIGWNAGTPCSDHPAQSAHFVSLLSERQAAHTGLASGQVFSGNIKGTRRRHVTVAGGCVELSVSLAECAALRDIPFVAVGEVGTQLGLRGLAARLERWPQVGAAIAGQVGEAVVVWGATTEEVAMQDDDDDVQVETVGRSYIASLPQYPCERLSHPTRRSRELRLSLVE
eukprot:Hpha_TRINITY_DN16404_c4_g4::TRINITY_DN16404_c4_g4_i2::g.160991::m.160991